MYKGPLNPMGERCMYKLYASTACGVDVVSTKRAVAVIDRQISTYMFDTIQTTENAFY